ncbi:MAG: hypothetical protein HC866_05755 [Leptolyngbyaceae cyanobacterium RU_5_1]|nr:hypothetical protein [Leptolyngbyaceae cyanobacterium RU_5_1]
MSSQKEAVIFIPGFYARSKGYFLENFLAVGLTTRLENKPVEMERDEVKIAGQSGRRFTYESEAGEQKFLDVYEIFWSDLIDKLSDRSVKDQVVRGIFLFIYWFFSGIWFVARKSRLLLVQIVIILFLTVLWYYGNVVIALVAIGQNPSAFGLQVLPAEWGSTLAAYGKTLGGWPIWAVASIILSFLPTSPASLVDVMDFIARYLQDETVSTVGGIRDRIRQRVAIALGDVLKEAEYERVTVLAHSAGVLVGIDLLADYRSKISKPIRFVSMGGQIEFLSYKSTWISEEAARCLDNRLLVTWEDYYSEQDWLSTKTPTPKSGNAPKFNSSRIQLRMPLAKQITGETHDAYFFERSLLERLLEWN